VLYQAEPLPDILVSPDVSSVYSTHDHPANRLSLAHQASPANPTVLSNLQLRH
jgi:hypothetical protein